jgi:phenylacetate-CoA ligase
MSVFSSSLALSQLLLDARRSSAELQPIILERLKQVLVAATGVPRHREMMRQAGYDPRRDFNGLADLAMMPLMTRTDLKLSPEAFLQEHAARRLDDFHKDRTSGSTGMPLTVYRSRRERDIQIAKWLRVLFLNGYRITDKVLSFTAPGRLAEGRSMLQKFGLLRRMAVDYTLTPEERTNAFLQYRPRVVYGVCTSLLMVAEELKRRGVMPAPVKLMVAGGEVIDTQARSRCRESFGTDITEIYGTVEMGVMAYQTPGEAALSLIEDCTLFEFLDDAGNPAKAGQLARVVVTDLNGQLMPFIRYEQRDLAIYRLKPDTRGEMVRVIERIVGRQDDIVRLPDGSALTFLDLYNLRYGYPEIQQLRVTQRAPLSFLVEIVADADYFRAIRGDVLQGLKGLSKLPLEFELRRVDQITPGLGGKMRILVAAVERS